MFEGAAVLPWDLLSGLLHVLAPQLSLRRGDKALSPSLQIGSGRTMQFTAPSVLGQLWLLALARPDKLSWTQGLCPQTSRWSCSRWLRLAAPDLLDLKPAQCCSLRELAHFSGLDT